MVVRLKGEESSTGVPVGVGFVSKDEGVDSAVGGY
jgi:hypothetical protein